MNYFDQFAIKLRANHHDFFMSVKAFWECLRRERESLPDQWPAFTRSCRKHELHSVLLQDPFTNRAFLKPRGYAGDALMLDFMYGHSQVRDLIAPSSEIGLRLLAYTAGGCSAARAVRWRCARAAQEIEAAAIRCAKARVLAIACGHMREMELVHPELRRRVQVTATDVDEDSLETVMQTHRDTGMLECQRVSVRDLILNTHGLDRGYDLVYALGLFDYLTDKVAERLASVLWSLVAPEGKLMLANFTPETHDAPYMEAIADWWLQYRTAEALEAFAALLENQTIATRQSFRDPLGQVAYLCLEKR